MCRHIHIYQRHICQPEILIFAKALIVTSKNSYPLFSIMRSQVNKIFFPFYSLEDFPSSVMASQGYPGTPTTEDDSVLEPSYMVLLRPSSSKGLYQWYKYDQIQRTYIFHLTMLKAHEWYSWHAWPFISRTLLESWHDSHPAFLVWPFMRTLQKIRQRL